MTTSRRDFLAQAAGLPLVLGLPLAGCHRHPAPAWLETALGRLRAEDRPGLLFRVPGGKEQRCELGHAITWHLLNSKDPDVHEVLLEAPILCLDAAVVQDRFRGARAADTLILVDGDGFVVDGLVFDPGENWSNFVPAARALLHGPGGRRLADRAERARKRSEAGALPVLVEERLAAPPEKAAKLRESIEAAWNAQAAASPGPRMPYGVEVTAQMKGGCGDCGCEEAPPSNAMVACGMARALPNARYFVKFL